MLLFETRICVSVQKNNSEKIYDHEKIYLSKYISFYCKPSIGEKILIYSDEYKVENIIHDTYEDKVIIDLGIVSAYSLEDFEYKCEEFQDIGFNKLGEINV